MGKVMMESRDQPRLRQSTEHPMEGATRMIREIRLDLSVRSSDLRVGPFGPPVSSSGWHCPKLAVDVTLPFSHTPTSDHSTMEQSSRLRYAIPFFVVSFFLLYFFSSGVQNELSPSILNKGSGPSLLQLVVPFFGWLNSAFHRASRLWKL